MVGHARRLASHFVLARELCRPKCCWHLTAGSCATLAYRRLSAPPSARQNRDGRALGENRMIRWILATCVFLAVFGCSADEASSKMSSQFVGRWTAQYSIKDQGAFRYVIDRKPDGGYELQTVRVDGDKVLERESESGRWFVQAGSYKVKTEKVEGKAANVRNVANYQTYTV